MPYADIPKGANQQVSKGNACLYDYAVFVMSWGDMGQLGRVAKVLISWALI
jgi:hypothetical protein